MILRGVYEEVETQCYSNPHDFLYFFDNSLLFLGDLEEIICINGRV